MAKIISASRRTDIPAFYSQWFAKRLEAGFCLVVNPFNCRQVSQVSLLPDDVAGVVFWTKNAAPMLKYLPDFTSWPYYFQYTLNAYDADLEPGVPCPWNARVETFRRLAALIGPERVLWRYDPIVITPKYSWDFHLEAFQRLAHLLRGATTMCTVSFVDMYRKNRANLKNWAVEELSATGQLQMLVRLNDLAQKCGIRIVTCAEPNHVLPPGVEPGCCVDSERLQSLTSAHLGSFGPANSRALCRCCKSVDIGAYNTCAHGCRYCYANRLGSANNLCVCTSELLAAGSIPYQYGE